MRFLLVMAMASLLAACGPYGETSSPYYGARPPAPPPYAAPYGYAAPPPPPPAVYDQGPSLSHMQRDALADGCMLRYSGIPHKLRECMNLGANWQDALAQGCQKRYSGIPHKLRECMEY